MAHIPTRHKKYNLLPFCREQGGEVFCYRPELLERINALLPDGENVTPYGYFTYREYYTMFDSVMENHLLDESRLYVLLKRFRKEMKDLNVKENWAVVRYLGKTTNEEYGLTEGRCYYWPCSRSHPEYIGVIDNEEYTAHIYPVDPQLWEVIDDPHNITSIMYNKSKAREIQNIYLGNT